MRLIIAGSRNYPMVTGIAQLRAWRRWISTATVVISGDAAGPDQWGVQLADEWRIPVEHHPALWKAEGRAAGMRRNERMAQRATALLALWDGQSRGTKHMIETASAAGLVVIVVAPGDTPCPPSSAPAVL